MQRDIGDVVRSSAPEWTGRPERSSPWANRLAVRLALAAGRPVTRFLLLLPICLYFFVFSPADRSASRKFLRRALEREPGTRDVFRHFWTFASTILDRLYLLDGQFLRFDVRTQGEQILTEMLARDEGCLLMGAHLGSFEILRFLGREHEGVRVSLVMYEDNARKLNTVLDAIDATRAMPVIALGKIDSMLKVQESLARGEFTGILADRTIAGEGTMSLPFFGEAAQFPIGPFRLAAMLKCPVVTMFGLYRGGNRYDAHFELLADLRETERGQRAAAMEKVQRHYVERLEHYCRLAPYNWFNFYDYWK